ncbi:MAG: hypothetical protein KDC13_01540 [Bacteroidetes bacterium]|nr:hypothetical protein [Bacteroidota bacterium]
MFLKKILYYLDIRTLFRKDGKKSNINLKFMNGMNRISIFMFLFALVVMIIRYMRR